MPTTEGTVGIEEVGTVEVGGGADQRTVQADQVEDDGVGGAFQNGVGHRRDAVGRAVGRRRSLGRHRRRHRRRGRFEADPGGRDAAVFLVRHRRTANVQTEPVRPFQKRTAGSRTQTTKVQPS